MHNCAKRLRCSAIDVLRTARSANAVATGDGLHNASYQRSFAAGPSFEYEPDYSKKHDIVRKSGVDVLHDPLYNKVSEHRLLGPIPH